MRFKLNFCEATPALAVGSVYGLFTFIVALDNVLNSGRPVTPLMGLLFILVTFVFITNVLLLAWSLFDPDWTRAFPRRQH